MTYYPINEDTAKRANDANSFRDYKPGSATAAYRAEVDKAAALVEKQKAKVDPINSINAGWLKDELGITDLLDARQNIQAGCYMLGMYLSEYEGNVNCALMAYNLGATGAKKAWSAGTYSTAYTDKVWNAMVGLLEGERDVS